jgi:hypothetical protein
MTIDHRQLRALIAAIAPLGLIGCGAPFGDFDSDVCMYGNDALADLAPSAGVDYVGLRSSYNTGDPEQPVQTVQLWGEACATAADPSACLDTLTALPMLEALIVRNGQTQVSYDVAVTGGDEVFTVSDKAGLITVLGSIDTPNEAALVAFIEGHDLACGEANVRAVGDGYELLGSSGSLCGGDVSHYEIKVGADGSVSYGESKVVEEGDEQCAIGRRPDGLCSKTQKARTLGAFFANAYHLEAASVPAFEQLALELAAHGAPRALVQACLRARADEVRHARTTARLARRFGARPVRPLVAPRSIRPLVDVALDNATEGCVRETFGAAVAHVQAQRSHNRRVRRAMRTIAVDETRHATLSWAIDAWAQSKLGPQQRRALSRARRQSVANLLAESARGWQRVIRDQAGMPSAEASLHMAKRMDETLWRG